MTHATSTPQRVDRTPELRATNSPEWAVKLEQSAQNPTLDPNARLGAPKAAQRVTQFPLAPSSAVVATTVPVGDPAKKADRTEEEGDPPRLTWKEAGDPALQGMFNGWWFSRMPWLAKRILRPDFYTNYKALLEAPASAASASAKKAAPGLVGRAFGACLWPVKASGRLVARASPSVVKRGASKAAFPFKWLGKKIAPQLGKVFFGFLVFTDVQKVRAAHKKDSERGDGRNHEFVRTLGAALGEWAGLFVAMRYGWKSAKPGKMAGLARGLIAAAGSTMGYWVGKKGAEGMLTKKRKLLGQDPRPPMALRQPKPQTSPPVSTDSTKPALGATLPAAPDTPNL